MSGSRGSASPACSGAVSSSSAKLEPLYSTPRCEPRTNSSESCSPTAPKLIHATAKPRPPPPSKAAPEIQRVLLRHRIEADPRHRQIRAVDGEIGRVLVPGRAPALAAFLQEHLLVHEPHVRRLPDVRDDARQRRTLQHCAIGLRAARIVEVLVEE